MRTLPPSIASAVSSIRWPLDATSSPPLYYEPLDRLSVLRSKSSAGSQFSPLDDVPGTLSSLFDDGDGGSDRQHYSTLAIALLLLGHGRTDECHDLVTPLSWPEETHFGHGPPLYSSLPPPVVSLASYTHSLVHRREAFNAGEYGMVGFSNANYWSSAALHSKGMESIPYRQIRQAVLDAATGNVAGTAWCRERIVDEGGDDDSYWEPRALHELCGRMLRALAAGRGDEDQQLREFAEMAAEAELRVLLLHCLERAGFECKEVDRIGESMPSMQKAPVDENMALAAANKVSSAHLASFEANGAVTLRNVVRLSSDGGSVEDRAALSAAAGVASRLLSAPGCCLVENVKNWNDGNNPGAVVRITLPTHEASVMPHETPASGGGTLSPGDIFAEKIERGEIHGSNGGAWRSFVACDTNDPRATFVDRLHGSRGETPTTVVQWSKGTIF